VGRHLSEERSLSGSTVEVTLCSSLDDAVAAGWKALVPDSELYASEPWLRIEGRLIAERRSFLVGVAEGAPAAGLTAILFDRADPSWTFARVDAVLRRLQQERSTPDTPAPADDLFTETLPNLLLGGRRPGHTRLLVAAHLDEPARRAAIDAVLQAAAQLARQSGAASLSLLHVDEDDQLLRQALAEAGYAEFPSAITSSLVVPASHEEYVESFPSRRRTMIRRDRRRLHEAGITYEVRPLSHELIEEILPLEIGLYEKHGNVFPPDDARRFHALVLEDMGADVRVLVALGGGAVRGFVVLVRKGDVIHTRQCGFDYDFQGNLPLYFGVLFYETMEHARRVGVGRIEHGIGSEEAKASRGCVQRRQYGYVRMLDPAAHAALVGRLPRD
jgi:uncharacterized protein